MEPRGAAIRMQSVDEAVLDRAQGLFVGQLAGDAVGSVVEFMHPGRIAREFPLGVDMEASPVWHTLPGQPTDDSELAIDLALALCANGQSRFPDDAVALGYARWLGSGPFDKGGTIFRAVSAIDPDAPNPAQQARTAANPVSEANGALMRESPLALWGWRLADDALFDAARKDCSLTHPHPVCQASSVVYVAALVKAVRDGADPEEVYDVARRTADRIGAPESVVSALDRARREAPLCHGPAQGHVIKALQNAFYQILHAPSLEEGIVGTAELGGDTDTNAAIAGALLGAVYGRRAVPGRWLDTLAHCEPSPDNLEVRYPRPERYWPGRALALAEELVSVGVGLGSTALREGDATWPTV